MHGKVAKVVAQSTAMLDIVKGYRSCAEEIRLVRSPSLCRFSLLTAAALGHLQAEQGE